jgi:hypothetical protein
MGYSPVYTTSNLYFASMIYIFYNEKSTPSTIQSPPESSDNLWPSFVVWQERDNASCHTPDPSTELLAALIPLKTIDTSPSA